MAEGATIAAIGPQLILLALWGVASFAVALRVFRWS
jgi:ABC-2 type transport system permease protein